MAKVTVHSTRNFLQTFPITFEFPVDSPSNPEIQLMKITGMTGHPEYVDPEEYFLRMKELLASGKPELRQKKGAQKK